jgi:hypothetical protein
MNQRFWGPYGWYTLHVLTTITPASAHTPDHYRLPNITQKILPCAACRRNYAQNLQSIDQVYLNPDAKKMRNETGNGLNRAFFDIHNIANIKLEKPVHTWEQFQADIQLNRITFHMNFPRNVMWFCSYVADAHDNIANEIQTDDVLEFFRIICACLTSFQSEPDIGTYCLDIATQGYHQLQLKQSEIASNGIGRTTLISLVDDWFGEFVFPCGTTMRPLPLSLASTEGSAIDLTSSSRDFPWPHYTAHGNANPKSYTYAPHNPNNSSKPSGFFVKSASGLFSPIHEAVSIARVKK